MCIQYSKKGKKDLSLYLEHVRQLEYLVHKEIEEYQAQLGKDNKVIVIFKKYNERIDIRVSNDYKRTTRTSETCRTTTVYNILRKRIKL